MSISGKTMNISKLTVGGEDIKEAMQKRTLTFTFPEMQIKTPLTLNFQNCVMSFTEDPVFDIAVVDAEDKFICGKLR